MAALEKAAHDEKARYQSEILFARQEHESSVRQRNLASQRPASKSRNAPSTKASPNKPKMPEKKGFQNSFSESSSRKDGPTNAPRSSPTETRPEGRSRSSAPLVNGKGKARAADLDSDHQIGDDSTLFMDQDLDVAEEDSSAVMPRSAKDSLVSFLFGHPTSPFQPATKSIQVLLDAKLGSSADPEAIQAHRQACQNLFACLSRPASTSATDVEQQDRIFLAQLILAIVNFVDVFSTNGMTGETIQALVLLRDLLFSFSKFLFHQEIMLTEHNKAIQAVFKLMVRLVRQQQVRYVAYLQKRRQTQNKSATQLGGNRQPSKSIVAISPYLWQEKEIDPTMQAVLAILCILAFRPDSVCLSKSVSHPRKRKQADFVHQVGILRSAKQALFRFCWMEVDQCLCFSILWDSFSCWHGVRPYTRLATVGANAVRRRTEFIQDHPCHPVRQGPCRASTCSSYCTSSRSSSSLHRDNSCFPTVQSRDTVREPATTASCPCYSHQHSCRACRRDPASRLFIFTHTTFDCQECNRCFAGI